MIKINRIIDSARKKRFFRSVIKIIKKYIFHYCQDILLSLSLRDPIPDIKPLNNIKVRKATAADVEDLCQIIKEYKLSRSRKEISDWIDKGYFFLLAISDNNIVGYACSSIEASAISPDIRKYINFKKDCLWGKDAFVHPFYRGNRIYPALGVETMKWAKRAGFKWILGTVSPQNESAKLAHKKLGFKEIKKFISIKIFFYKRVIIKPLKGEFSHE